MKGGQKIVETQNFALLTIVCSYKNCIRKKIAFLFFLCE